MPQIDPLDTGASFSVTFTLPPPREHEEVVIPAPGLGTIAAALRLDPKADAPPESTKERILRLARQAKILLGKEHEYLVDVLSMSQMATVVQSLYLAGRGIDPSRAVEYFQRLARERKRDAAEVLVGVEALVAELAARLKITPEEAGKIPAADALRLRDQLFEQDRERLKNEAALHGICL